MADPRVDAAAPTSVRVLLGTRSRWAFTPRRTIFPGCRLQDGRTASSLAKQMNNADITELLGVVQLPQLSRAVGSGGGGGVVQLPHWK